MEIVRDPNTQIWKFLLEVTDRAGVLMPQGAEILHVGVQGTNIYVWAKIDTKATTSMRWFYVVGTGHDMPLKAGQYLGTVHLRNGALVFHIFEEA
jgi:hypothetical protein